MGCSLNFETSTTCSMNFSNRFSFLGSICAECDLNSCMCKTDSQITDTEGTYSMGHDDNQVISVQSAQFSETGFTVMLEQHESFYNHDVASMTGFEKPGY